MTDTTDPEIDIVKRVDAVIGDLGAGRIRGKPLSDLDRAVQDTKSAASVSRAINRKNDGGFHSERG